jgi:hypothetical protein
VYLPAMALLRSAGAGHFLDHVVIRLATAVAFAVIWLAEHFRRSQSPR